MAFINLTGNGRKTPVQLDRILHGSLQYIRLPLFQRLLSCVLDLIDLTRVSDLANMNVARKSGASRQLANLQTYMVLDTRIGKLWLEYIDDAADVEAWYFRDSVSTGTVYFRDAFSALVVAYFTAARILLGIVTLQLTNLPPTMSNHCSTIQQASQYLQTHTIGCAHMRMATPMLLVALHAPESSQRKQATSYFEGRMGRSMSGISALALDTIHRHSTGKHSRTNDCATPARDLDARATLSLDKSTVKVAQTTQTRARTTSDVPEQLHRPTDAERG
ncbi:hypothetical protein G6011_02622 [Alternaria panax]|uniref:Uncharacterized protein n=1 Tax=Alternaria panax TaxID=48097 RepID=A0AAD4FAJ4_9PLEO|nr:hypothetical protein G6011_02622 [Alternaria panax]